MDLAGKLIALDKIYTLYDQFTASLELACKKYCSHCCTTRVTLTTIEGYKIIRALVSTTNRTTGGLDFTAIGGKRQRHEVPQSLRVKPGASYPVWKTQSGAMAGWEQKIRQAAIQDYFKPKITTNQLANLCADGIEPPQEKMSASKSCPFLTEKQCPIYALRPFGCRCLVSRHDCAKEGHADMEDFVLSVNTLFLQAIEHMDAEGCSGNLLDVLRVMNSRANQQDYKDHRLECSRTGLIANQPLKVLMIPPQHRSKMEPILQSLREIRF